MKLEIFDCRDGISQNNEDEEEWKTKDLMVK